MVDSQLKSWQCFQLEALQFLQGLLVFKLMKIENKGKLDHNKIELVRCYLRSWDLLEKYNHSDMVLYTYATRGLFVCGRIAGS